LADGFGPDRPFLSQELEPPQIILGPPRLLQHALEGLAGEGAPPSMEHDGYTAAVGMTINLV